jgi:hypothetical protein
LGSDDFRNTLKRASVSLIGASVSSQMGPGST